MKQTTSRMLFAYWDAIRGERAAPDRADVKPVEMRHVLADTFILATEEHAVPSFRLAGTRINALFARELGGETLHGLWTPGERADLRRIVEIVSRDTIGAVLGVVGTNVNGSAIPLECLLLPLRHRGRTDVRIIGSLSASSLPSWAGLVPLRSLSTQSFRMIEPGRTIATRSAKARVPVARRNLFVVHEGGRA